MKKMSIIVSNKSDRKTGIYTENMEYCHNRILTSKYTKWNFLYKIFNLKHF